MKKNLKIKIKNTQLGNLINKSKIKDAVPSEKISKKSTFKAKKLQALSSIQKPEPLDGSPVEEKLQDLILPKEEEVKEEKKPDQPPKEEPKTPKENFKKGVEKEKKEYEKKRNIFSRVFDGRSTEDPREHDSWRRWRQKKQKSNKIQLPVERPSEISVKMPVSVKTLSLLMKIKGSDILHKLFILKQDLTINDVIEDASLVEIICQEFGCKVNIDASSCEDILTLEPSIEEEIANTSSKDLKLRPPVVTIMGHVDHGKTSIIDKFRKSNLVHQEQGNITQHIGAFNCKTKYGQFTMLDTPGHEAFSSIRSRGANVTDIVVLVIAGDEGIKVQTEEAIKKAKDVKVPIVVAINKSDKEGFNADEIYRQLSERDLLPEVWGGKTVSVNCSAKSGDGINTLGEMIALQAEVLELKANPKVRARGFVLESEKDPYFGCSVTLLVRNGTLHVNDIILFDLEYAKVKSMMDESQAKISSAEPSKAVRIRGASGIPSAGVEFFVMKSEKYTKEVIQKRRNTKKRISLKQEDVKNFRHLLQEEPAPVDNKKVLHLIIKADTIGSLEALEVAITSINVKNVNVVFLSKEIGEIVESDVDLTKLYNTMIIGFNTKVNNRCKKLIKENNTQIFTNSVIYNIVDKVKEVMIGLKDKIRKENKEGSAEILVVFTSVKIGNIAGCKVINGVIKKSHEAKLLRNGSLVWNGQISSLKKEKDSVKEVKKGLECGILLENFGDIKVGDIIEAYEITYELDREV